jgi:hypothetical protein
MRRRDSSMLGFCAAGLALVCVFHEASVRLATGGMLVMVAGAFVVLVAAGTQALRYFEERRCERIRTCYLGRGVVFNCETGELKLDAVQSPIEVIAGVISGLTYDVERGRPEVDGRFDIEVHTYEFAEDGEIWSGVISFVDDDEAESIPFDSRIELAWVLEDRRKAAGIPVGASDDAASQAA